jgi:hypothetical protein
VLSRTRRGCLPGAAAFTEIRLTLIV